MDSVWHTERAHYPRSKLPRDADVVVVGAGLVGVTTALELSAAGRHIVVLDRGAVAAGASGRNGGLLLPGTAERYTELIARWGPARARDLWAMAERGARALVDLIGEHAVDCAFRPEGGLHVAASPAEAAALQDAVIALVADGFDVTWLDRAGLARWADVPLPEAFAGATLVPGGGPLHSGRLVTGLAAAAAAAGVEFAEPVTVTAVRETGAGVVVETDGGRIGAGGAAVTTNAWAGRLVPALAGLVTPVRGQVLATAPTRPSALRGAWSINEGYEYLQQLPGGRLVAGGKRWTAHDQEVGYDVPGVNVAIHRRLDSWLASAFPALGPLAVEHRWAGIMAWTPDRLPLVGPVGPDERLWVAAGFNGHGLPFAVPAARILAAGLSGRLAPEGAAALDPERFAAP